MTLRIIQLDVSSCNIKLRTFIKPTEVQQNTHKPKAKHKLPTTPDNKR